MAYLTAPATREETVVNFASLALLVPLLEKLNIANIIDRHIPTDPQAEYSHGTVLRTKTPFDCRVLFVHSSAAAKESKKNIVKIHAGLDATARKLEKAHTSTTPESVVRQITRLLGKKSAAHFFRWELVPLTEAEQATLPRPTKGHRSPTHRLVYSFDHAAAEEDTRHDGIYALVTTAPLTWSGDDLLTEYKRQTYVEREHHELKTPLAVTPIFLKTPSRPDPHRTHGRTSKSRGRCREGRVCSRRTQESP